MTLETYKAWLEVAVQTSVLVFGGVLTVAVIVLLWRAQQASENVNPFDAAQMFQDDQNRTSGSKFVGLIGGVASIWVIVFLTVSGHLDSTLFIGWLAVVILGKVGSEAVSKIGG